MVKLFRDVLLAAISIAGGFLAGFAAAGAWMAIYPDDAIEMSCSFKKINH